MKALRKRLNSEVIRRGYSEEEICHIYELARFSLENGDPHRAEIIGNGLIEVAPDFAPAWLLLACLRLQSKSYDTALQAAEQALKVDSESIEARLFLIACHLTLGDLSAAGTQLGEVGEAIELGAITEPNLLRFYRAQLTRYQNLLG